MTCRRLLPPLLLATFALLAAPVHAQSPALVLDVKDGRVTLDARNVTVAQILEQWGRLQQIAIVNADALASTRVTMRLDGVPDRDALATLLRGVNGYIATRRAARSGIGMEIDRILIVRGSTVVPPVAASRAPAVRAAATRVDPDDDVERADRDPAARVGNGARAGRDVIAAGSASAEALSSPASDGQDPQDGDAANVTSVEASDSSPAAAPAAGTNAASLPPGSGVQGVAPQRPANLRPPPPGMVRTGTDGPPPPHDLRTYNLPAPAPASQAVNPNPFGVSSGHVQPGTIAPVKK